MQHPAEKSQLLSGPDAELNELPYRSLVVIGRAVQASLLKRWFSRGPVLGDAREDGLAVLHDEVDVELNTVEILLEQQIISRTTEIVEYRVGEFLSDHGVHARQIRQRVDAHATDLSRA